MGNCNTSPTHSNLDLIKKPSWEKDKHQYKTIILGDQNVGKTSIIQFLIQEKHSEIYKPTLGFAYQQKLLKVANGEQVCLQIWDTAGSDAYKELISLFYRNSNAVLLVFDHSNKKSLDNIRYWIEELQNRIDLNEVIIVVIGNKWDLVKGLNEEERVTEEEIREACLGESYRIFNTSSLQGVNIKELFQYVAEQCYQKFATG